MSVFGKTKHRRPEQQRSHQHKTQPDLQVSHFLNKTFPYLHSDILTICSMLYFIIVYCSKYICYVLEFGILKKKNRQDRETERKRERETQRENKIRERPLSVPELKKKCTSK